jgi:hypothetical protein
VGVGNVEAHPARAAGADLDVCARARAPQTLGDDLHVADELREGEAEEVLLDGGWIQGSAAARALPQIARALIQVLIGERRRGVDAVDDGVRLVAHQEANQQAPLEHLFGEIAEQIVQHQRTVFGAAEHRGEVDLSGGHGQEHVAPLDRDRGAPAVGLEGARRRLHFVFVQGHQHEPARRGGEYTARHGMAHQAAAAQQHHRCVSQFHAVARSSRSPSP